MTASGVISPLILVDSSMKCFSAIISCMLGVALAAENRRAEVDLLLSQYQLNEAEQKAKEWLSQEEKKVPSVDLADALESLAAVQVAKGDAVAKIRPLVEQALSIRTKIAGAGDSSLARDFNLLGALQFRATDFHAAITEYRRAEAIQKDETPVLADTLSGLGQATGFGGDPKAGIEFVRKALAIREAQLPGTVAVAEALNMMGTLSYQANQPAQAEEYFLRARKMVGPDHFLGGQIDGGLATLYKERGDFREAEALQAHVVKVFEARLGPEHPRLVVQYNNLGLERKELGDLEGAQAALEHALAISEKANGPESSTTATVLGNLGIALKERGDLESARAAYERAVAIQEKRLGPDHQLLGAVLYSLGSLVADMGDIEGGKALLVRALAITDKALGPGSVRGVQIMDQLGSLLACQKNFKESRAMFQRAWEESRRVYGDDNSRTAAALASIAASHSYAGDYDRARERYRAALEVDTRRRGAAHYYTLATEYAMARNEQAAGSYAVALALFEEVSAEWRKQFGDIYPELADSLGHQAECLERLGRGEESLKAALEAASIRRTNLEIAAHASGDREALLYAAKDRVGLDMALRLAASSGTAVRDVWDAVIRERALVLDEMAERHAALESDRDPVILSLAAKVTSAREELAKAVLRGPSDQQNYAARLVTLRSRADASERELAGRSKRFLEQRLEGRKGFAEVAAALPEGSALIAYVRYSEGYAAFVLRAGGAAPRCVRLGTAQAVNGAIERWRKEIDRERDSMGRSAARNEVSYREAGLALKHLIWDPMAKFIPNSGAVYLVGDGAITLVNFLSLPVGTASYLVETGPDLRVLSSERDLADTHRTSGGGLLAVGAPAFDRVAAKGNGSLRSVPSACAAGFTKLVFSPLPGAASEVQEISRIGQQRGVPTQTLTGENATKSAFEKLAPGKRLIHVATHGFFLDSRCSSNSPLLRAGLAFAGANSRVDGILTAEEVASLNLESAEWVVLSGCDTGAGEVQTGEGVVGLRRAFRIAGARTLVMSLWPVDDLETKRWMVDLYEAHLGGRRNAAASVRSASRQQLLKRRAAGLSTHPFYWAGFIAVGAI